MRGGVDHIPKTSLHLDTPPLPVPQCHRLPVVLSIFIRRLSSIIHHHPRSTSHRKTRRANQSCHSCSAHSILPGCPASSCSPGAQGSAIVLLAVNSNPLVYLETPVLDKAYAWLYLYHPFLFFGVCTAAA
jgi:hypothetical protein